MRFDARLVTGAGVLAAVTEAGNFARAAEILGMIGETPDITLSELAEHLDEAHGLKAAQSTIW